MYDCFLFKDLMKPISSRNLTRPKSISYLDVLSPSSPAADPNALREYMPMPKYLRRKKEGPYGTVPEISSILDQQHRVTRGVKKSLTHKCAGNVGSAVTRTPSAKSVCMSSPYILLDCVKVHSGDPKGHLAEHARLIAALIAVDCGMELGFIVFLMPAHLTEN
jgi:hypothetical protein